MKIGQFVKRHIPAIFDYCETVDQTEFPRLQDPRYCKETFGIHYPFCKPVAKIEIVERVRYWKNEYRVDGIPVRVTSQWFNPPTSNSLSLFHRYLKKRGIEIAAGSSGDAAQHYAAPRGAKGRFKGNAIGNAQNAFIRNLLSNIGDEQFSAEHWQAVIADFDNCCAYCGNSGDLVMDHVVAINRTALGEHRLGNLVPACRSCNAAKGDQDFRAFLSDDPERIGIIETHMAKHDYVPIGANGKLREVVEIAHNDVRQLAERYIRIIDSLLDEDTGQT